MTALSAIPAAALTAWFFLRLTLPVLTRLSIQTIAITAAFLHTHAVATLTFLPTGTTHVRSHTNPILTGVIHRARISIAAGTALRHLLALPILALPCVALVV